MTRPLPDHGTLSRHKYHGCKCDPCVDNYRAYQRTRHRKKGYGTWQPYVDAEPVRQHILHLREQGFSVERIAELAGLYPANIAGFLYDFGPNRPRKKGATPENARKILAVTAETAIPAIADATGTRRRLQALAALGWPMRSLGPRIGVHPATVSRLAGQGRVYARTAQAVEECYRQLADQRPEEHGVPAGVARKTRNHAAAQGWPDPTWWEDYGHIDDPAFDPTTAETTTANSRRDPLAAEEIRHLAAFGVALGEIARRVGRSENYVKQVVNGWTARNRRQQYGEAA